jgi:hypothetical protein
MHSRLFAVKERSSGKKAGFFCDDHCVRSLSETVTHLAVITSDSSQNFDRVVTTTEWCHWHQQCWAAAAIRAGGARKLVVPELYHFSGRSVLKCVIWCQPTSAMILLCQLLATG